MRRSIAAASRRDTGSRLGADGEDGRIARQLDDESEGFLAALHRSRHELNPSVAAISGKDVIAVSDTASRGW